MVCIIAALLLTVTSAAAQGSRKDDIVFGPAGHPVAGAMVRVCQPTATGTPCSPLATLYTDATLTTTASNPLQTDGIGNYHFYAPAGRYLLQITGASIQGTENYPDVILPPDVSSNGSGNDISAFGLTLGGNLSVAGNATVTGTLTTANFSPRTFTPSSLTVNGNTALSGPRPYIDVTAPPYNANPTGATDATASIQAAITAACGFALESSSPRPGIYFPPGTYHVTQTQGGSSVTTPIFDPTCGDLYVYSNGSQAWAGQGRTEPQGAVILVTNGSNPDAGPVFLFTQQSGSVHVNGVTIENLSMQCYNQCVQFSRSGNDKLLNDSMASANTGFTDNTPLKLTNDLWILINGGSYTAATGSLPTMIWTGETPTFGEGSYVNNVTVENVWSFGGGFQYIQRYGPTATLAGSWVFRNVLQENNNASPFMNVAETTAGNLPGLLGVEFDNSYLADYTAPEELLNLNFAGYSQSITFHNSVQQGGGANLLCLQQGILRSYESDSQGYIGSCGGGTVWDGSQIDSAVGLDFTSGAANFSDSGTTIPTTAFDGPLYPTISTRWFTSGAALARVAIDASTGLLFGDGATHGYTSGVQQNATGDVDLETQALLPPTNLAGTATTGGTLGAGTYYAVLWITSGGGISHCNPSPTPFWYISSFAYSAAVTVSGSNNAINWTWTAPASAPAANNGYCMAILTSAPAYEAPVGQALNFSAPATSFLYAGQTQTSIGNTYPIGWMLAVHWFTYNSLGVNTTTPNYNLDVNGTAAVNSLNAVQKAERFAGGDAGVQINACLTAASTTSGVCDARGMTGTYTATHHISIPAHTALMWCQGKLTINDSGTNDAVEFAGDGGGMYGCGETGSGTVPRPQTSGYIACGIAGCTAADNPNAATANIDWIHIDKMYLQANGASSTVLNLSSVGHSDIENNRFVLGTGGGSYGVYGNTSAGNEDSTNSLVKHNEFDAQSQNDTCVYLAGVFNSIKVEQNSCYLPAENMGTIGFALAKDSNGNYPDNDEFDANDCEAATTSFGQICFNLIGAQNVQIGPTNRCENVYNCIQYPSDGSAVGNHMIDPYLSLSVNTMVKPNEPAAAQQAMDNTGTNWQPSFYYGLNDLGGANLLTNPGFEGWSNSTTLFAWGGVSGTNINQAGSGIYAQQQSSASPADSTTQGSYSVKIGDNATAGLGVNSGCVAVDSTMNYTLAFRVASTSTSAKFRPGLRFYSDPNCTEADRITSVATNARVLQPAYYAGTSALAGTGANWQSTNASLTYNNGITCNCSVTGADFNVATANTWTPTRNFAITFRVPNAFSSSITTAQSMRVFILENTAANPNQVFVDDVALSQGPVNTRVPHASTVTENGACIGCGINTVTSYSVGTVTAGAAPGAANQVDISVIYLPNVSFSHITVDVSTSDANTGDFYSWAITDLAGNVKCSMSAAVNLTATGTNEQPCSQGTVTLANGNYIFAFTGNATTAKIAYSGTAPLAFSTAVSTSSSSSGAMTFPIGMPTAGQTFSSYGLPAIILN
jgi:hypothetical protein